MMVLSGFLTSCSNNPWSPLRFLLVCLQCRDRSSHSCIPIHGCFWFRGCDYNFFRGFHGRNWKYLGRFTSEEGVRQHILKGRKNLGVILTTVSTKTVIFHKLRGSVCVPIF